MFESVSYFAFTLHIPSRLSLRYVRRGDATTTVAAAALSPDKISYGILIKSYCDSGSHEKAIEIMRQMEGKGMEVTAIVFTTILSSLYKKGEVEVAESLWNEMVKKGCEMDNTAYNVRLINAQKESPGRVMELIEEMSTMGLKPDAISYNFLVTAYCEKGMLDEQGYAMFKKSVDMHKIPDFNTLKHLAVGLVRNKKIDDAKGLISTAKKTFPPSFLVPWKNLEEDLGLVPRTRAFSFFT